ncbi:hypothetical protein DV735_g5420, partial [Chaetothyriales sp. CBS 134920]
MDPHQYWTREKLDSAFEQSEKDGSTVFLDSFGRRVFQYKGRIIKYGRPVDLQEAKALAFIKQSGLNIPVPQVYFAGSCGDTKVIEMEMIEGETLEKIWDGLTEQERHGYALQLRQVVDQLHSLEGSYIGSLEGGPAVDARRFRNYGGPFADETEFNKFLLSNTISKAPPIYRKMVESILSDQTHRIVFTHGDLTPTNIMVKEGRIVGIIDWENAGWYPEYWEFLQFLRGMYRNYRDYGDVIFEKLYPVAFMTDHLLGYLTKH